MKFHLPREAGAFSLSFSLILFSIPPRLATFAPSHDKAVLVAKGAVHDPKLAEDLKLADDLTLAEIRAIRRPNVKNYLELSVQDDRNRKYWDSIAACKAVLKLDPGNGGAYNNMIAAYNGLGLWDEAIRAGQEALRISPSFELARSNLKWALSQKKRYAAGSVNQESLIAAEIEAILDPTPENYLNLSLEYYRREKYRESVAASQEALKLDPNYAEAYNNIAAAYNGLMMWDEAIQAAQQAVRLKPDYPQAQNNLQYSLNQKRLKDSSGIRK